jgi:hypothetical protein
MLGIASAASGAGEKSKAWPVIAKVEAQPLLAQVERLKEALAFIGRPLSAENLKAIEAARDGKEEAIAKGVQDALDPLCLAAVTVGKDEPCVERAGSRCSRHRAGGRYSQGRQRGRGERDLDVQSPNARPVPGGPRTRWGTGGSSWPCTTPGR